MPRTVTQSIAVKSAWRRVLPGQLLDLAMEPAEVFPHLMTRRHARTALLFPAATGIFVAYTLAKGLAIGDRLGFWTTVAGVVVIGAALGIAALWFIGSLPDWRHASDERQGGERAWMYLVCSYAAWPFLPLLFLVAGVDLLLHGTLVFSAARAPLAADIVWTLRALVVGAALFSTLLLVTGTAIVRRETEQRAAREVTLWLAQLAGLGVLLAIIVVVWLKVW
jgi:hypothetical protein